MTTLTQSVHLRAVPRGKTVFGTRRWIPRSWGLVGAVGFFLTQRTSSSHPGKPLWEQVFPNTIGMLQLCIAKQICLSNSETTILALQQCQLIQVQLNPPRMIHSKLNHIYFQFIITLTTGNFGNFIFWVQQQATGCIPLVRAWERCLSLFFVPLPVLPP